MTQSRDFSQQGNRDGLPHSITDSECPEKPMLLMRRREDLSTWVGSVCGSFFTSFFLAKGSAHSKKIPTLHALYKANETGR